MSTGKMMWNLKCITEAPRYRPYKANSARDSILMLGIKALKNYVVQNLCISAGVGNL